MSDDGGEETTLDSVTSQNNQINLQGPLILLSNHHQSPANLLRQRNVLELDRRVCWPLSLPLSSYKMSHLTSLESQTCSVSDIWPGPASLSFYWLQVVGWELTLQGIEMFWLTIPNLSSVGDCWLGGHTFRCLPPIILRNTELMSGERETGAGALDPNTRTNGTICLQTLSLGKYSAESVKYTPDNLAWWKMTFYKTSHHGEKWSLGIKSLALPTPTQN